MTTRGNPVTHTTALDPARSLVAKWRRQAEGNYSDRANALSRCADELEAALSAPERVGEWTTAKPAAQGIYRVRGWNLGRPDAVAIVTVASYDNRLVCNLHEVNSETDPEEWDSIDNFSDRFEWQFVSALTAAMRNEHE